MGKEFIGSKIWGDKGQIRDIFTSSHLCILAHNHKRKKKVEFKNYQTDFMFAKDRLTPISQLRKGVRSMTVRARVISKGAIKSFG
jgi:hypothetical protein